ncbi:hypothetical protein chiPu_0019014 [Chiloscyllium punctatum]|uniref:Ig-like domain-containing protein n=1 Tax=Chiloscyllium punctatum TaxID=137246 RepID=A0A401RQM1_CHIPU|nr:hypothetical protein [Chiloscyllium punctatum]
MLADPSNGNSVTQSLSSAVHTEGEAVTLSCTYDTTLTNYWLSWYRQRLDRPPEYILGKRTGGSEDKADFAKNRFSGELQISNKFTSLTVTGLELTDSAVYYCALSDTVMINSLSTVQKLPLDHR